MPKTSLLLISCWQHIDG